MVKDNQARAAALKFLLNIDPRAAYTYEAARKTMVDIINGENISHEYYQNTLNSALGLAYFKGYKLPVGGVIFRGDAWHEYVDVISDAMSYKSYMGYQIKDLAKQLTGVDIDDIVSVLLAQKLIRSSTKLTNGRYITVYTKNW